MQSKKEMTLVSGINNPDENRCEEAASEAESRRSLKEILESIGEPADRAPASGGIFFNLLHEDGCRRSLNETLDFIQEALEKPEEPDSVPLSADDAASIEEAKAEVNRVIRDVDTLLEEFHTPLLRNKLLLTINGALLFAHILGIYSKRTESMRERLEKVVKKQAAMLNAEKSAKERSKNAERKWQSHAEGLSKEIRAANPRASQDKVADEIGSRWILSLDDLPSHRTLVRFISKLEREKKLPPRAS
jgi:hypothetical protein